MRILLIVLALPGVVVHELGHYLFCRACGAPVREVVFFDPGDASGFVVHAVPRRLAQHAVIVAGPLLLNSALGFLLFRVVFAEASWGLYSADWLLSWRAAQAGLAVVLGASIALQAIPSYADANSLWRVSLDRLGAGHLLAVLALPIAGSLVLVNHLRRFWFDWLYAAALAALAIWLPVR
ncbi:MAG TPA: hypothetical protein VIO35_03735 [Chloroflexota bacterium]